METPDPFNSKKEEEEEETTIKDLPLEVWQEILLTSPLDFKDTTSLVNVFPNIKNYIQVIEGRRSNLIPAKDLFLFPRLAKISRNYKVKVETKEDFIKIARSPLREISLDISDLVKGTNYDKTYYDEVYALIGMFLSLKSDRLQTSDFYLEFRILDEDHDYNEEIHFIFRLELYPWTFELYPHNLNPSVDNLNTILKNFSITSFKTTGLDDKHIIAFDENAPNLSVIDYEVLNNDFPETSWINRALYMLNSIEEINLVTFTDDTNYDQLGISDIVNQFAYDEAVFVFIRRFLPVYVEDLPNMEKVFPNLTEINLAHFPQTDDVEEYLPYLEKYDRINIYKIYDSESIATPVMMYENPLYHLKKRIRFVDVRWMRWHDDYWLYYDGYN